MSQISWTFDAPTGTFKSHVMSSKVRETAIPQTEFFKYVTPEPGYGRNKGETITISRVGNLDFTVNGTLTEGVKIPEDEFAINVTSITVSEWGRAVPYSSLARDLTHFDLENQVQARLRDQMSLILDKAAATAFKACKIKAEPTGAAALTLETSGTATNTATVNLNLFHLQQIRDYARETLFMPGYGGPMTPHVLLASTKAMRGLKSDPDLQKWFFHTSPEVLQSSELGTIEGTRLIEVGNTNSLANNLGSGGVLGEAIYFGDDPIVMALVVDPELRMGVPADFGRSMAVCWYGVLQFGEPRPTANPGQARIIHVTSA